MNGKKRKVIPKNIVVVLAFLLIIVIGFVFLQNQRSNNIPAQTLNDNQSHDTSESRASFIESLRKREFKGGEIKIEETLQGNNSYSSYIISYPSDNLKIYGAMNVPNEDGPFPVIVLNHGYFNASSFTSGDGTRTMADILATNGYITLASDYRGFGKSEDASAQGARGHRPEYAIDVLNLISSIKTLPKADVNKIGIWGHSMGGEVSLRAAEVTNQISTIVLWAPTSARASDNLNFYSRRHSPGSSPAPSSNDGASPINYLNYIQAPISIHQGLADTEVNPEWSKELKSALEKEEKQVEYLEYPGQDHNFRNLGWGDISQKTIEFFQKHLKT